MSKPKKVSIELPLEHWAVLQAAADLLKWPVDDIINVILALHLVQERDVKRDSQKSKNKN
jgi:myo-inositol catabolism protein IolC